MPYQFMKALETGNDLVDREHRELIDVINALLDLCCRGQGQNEPEKGRNTSKTIRSSIIKVEDKKLVAYLSTV